MILIFNRAQVISILSAEQQLEKDMKLAMVGLGKMGANMVRRLVRDGHEVAAYDLDAAATESLASESGAITAADSLAALLAALPRPRVVWLMVPHQFVDSSIDDLTGVVSLH